MIEAEWPNQPDFAPLLRSLDDRLPDRKKRLLAVAFCRLAGDLLNHPVLLEALETAERYADGNASGVDLENCRSRCRELAVREYEVWAGTIEPIARQQRSEIAWAAAFATTTPLELTAVCGKTITVGDLLSPTDSAGSLAELALNQWLKREQNQAHRARIADVAGDLFEPVAFSDDWRTSTVVAIAQQMYVSRDFSAMPILADALQDAGCDIESVLNHCREPGTHIRGCWVVDLVLGKV
jgi:hypothetical protein